MLKKYKVKTEQNIMMWKFISPTEAQKSMLKKNLSTKKYIKVEWKNFKSRKSIEKDL